MPASEETYRSQPTLHIFFAISSIAMTLSIIWMIMADHFALGSKSSANSKSLNARS